MGTFRKIARHGMTKGAAFFYAVAVGAGANLVLDYVHRHDATPVEAHEIAPDAATAPIVSRPTADQPHPALSAPREALPTVKPLPPPAQSADLPAAEAVPILPPPAKLPAPPLKPAELPTNQPAMLPPPSAAAASASLSPVTAPPQATDRHSDKSAEVVATPPAAIVATPPAATPGPPATGGPVSLALPALPLETADGHAALQAAPASGAPISLLPAPQPPAPPAKPPAPKSLRPGPGSGGLY